MLDWLAVALALVLSLLQAPVHNHDASRKFQRPVAVAESNTNTSQMPNATSGLDPWGGV